MGTLLKMLKWNLMYLQLKIFVYMYMKFSVSSIKFYVALHEI